VDGTTQQKEMQHPRRVGRKGASRKTDTQSALTGLAPSREKQAQRRVLRGMARITTR
jgi:hypothetical protein